MKKLMILAAAAIAVAACSKTYDAKPEGKSEIGFGTWTENLTKDEARVQGTSTFLAGDTFAVYGYKVNNSTNDVVFDDVVVTASGSGTLTWGYSPKRFWDQSATSYTFYAVSPSAIGTAATVDAETGEVASASITFAGSDNDILVADKKEVLPAAYNTKVPLVFNHIASLVDFKVKKHTNLGDAVLAITSFSISNIDSVGTFSVSDAYTNDHPVVTWTESAYGTYTNASGVTSVTLPTAVTTSGNDLIDSLVVMPQAFRSAANSDSNVQAVNIAYTITDEDSNVNTFTSSFELKLFDSVDDDDNADTIVESWEAGKHYTFYITINANVIEFSASITDWTAVNGYNYLVQ
ncbi:MAG: fimbrillin family protein [Bacteroidales bacterium]|nr:fimbrillin family protein [Bacteroidales bacterium]